jgi:predicted component of type VI protein secretion system
LSSEATSTSKNTVLDSTEQMEKEGGSSSRTDMFPAMELNLEPGSLKELSPEKIKEEIKRWAKAVVAYARQLSFSSLDKA